MTQFVSFSGKISRVVFVDRRHDRHLIDYLQIKSTIDESIRLFWIVGQQTNATQAEVFQEFERQTVRVAYIHIRAILVYIQYTPNIREI